jgi:hypothetical protein
VLVKQIIILEFRWIPIKLETKRKMRIVSSPFLSWTLLIFGFAIIVQFLPFCDDVII